MDGELNISLEPHLVQTLLPLRTLLPTALSAELDAYLADSPPPTIPYSLLSSISKWSRSQPGQAALCAHRPPLRSQDYSMIALLAGTVTSPERHFPAVVPQSLLSEEERKRQITDKKAIATLVNALLSIAGSGVATWIVAQRWRHEWRVLLSFLVAVVVAVSEIILYIIWQSRRSSKQVGQSRRVAHSLYKKNDGDIKPSNNSDIRHTDVASQGDGQAVRLRHTAAIVQED